MIGCSRVRILMVGQSKFNKKAMARICGFSEIDHLIIDGAIGKPLLHNIEEAGLMSMSRAAPQLARQPNREEQAIAP